MLVWFVSVVSVLIKGSSFTFSSSTASTCRRTDSPSTTLRRSCILRFGLEHLESASSSSTSRCYRVQALEQKKNYTTSLCYVARTLTNRGSDEEKVHILHPLPNIYISAAWPSPSLLLTKSVTSNQKIRSQKDSGAKRSQGKARGDQGAHHTKGRPHHPEDRGQDGKGQTRRGSPTRREQT